MDHLKDHLLEQIHGIEFSGEVTSFTDAKRESLIIVQNAIYEHKIVSVNYPTYDLQQEQDTINPRTCADILLLSHETDLELDCHPYWYVWVVKIFHVYICYYGRDSQSHNLKCIDVLFVRWFGQDKAHRSSFSARRLPHIGFIPEEDLDSFGFLDPNVVIRDVHLIPAFSLGQTEELLGPLLAWPEKDSDEDWQAFYINM